jgi:hypothetical protein
MQPFVDAEVVADAARERVVCERVECESVATRVLEAAVTVVRAVLALWRAASSSGKAEVCGRGLLGRCASIMSQVEVLLELMVEARSWGVDRSRSWYGVRGGGWMKVSGALWRWCLAWGSALLGGLLVSFIVRILRPRG